MKKLLLGLTATLCMFGAVAGAAQAEIVTHRVVTVVRPAIVTAPALRVGFGVVAPVYTAPIYPAPIAPVVYTTPVYPAPVVTAAPLVTPVFTGANAIHRRAAWLRWHRLHEVVVR